MTFISKAIMDVRIWAYNEAKVAAINDRLEQSNILLYL